MSAYNRRLADLMRHYLGRTVMDALGDNDIEEVYVNPDTVVRFVSRSRGGNGLGSPRSEERLVDAIG